MRWKYDPTLLEYAKSPIMWIFGLMGVAFWVWVVWYGVIALWEDGGWHNIVCLAVTCGAVGYVLRLPLGVGTFWTYGAEKPISEDSRAGFILGAIWGALGVWIASAIRGSIDGWIFYVVLVFGWGIPTLKAWWDSLFTYKGQ